MVYKKLETGISFLIAILFVFSCSGNKKGEQAAKKFPASEPSYVEVSISGMTCTGCEQTVQKRVTDLEGVKSVKASFTTGKALVEYYPVVTDTVEIKNAIAASGYIVQKFKPVSGSGYPN